MSVNSRSKGARGEKQAIEFMEAWTPYKFKRTPGSGGLRGHVAEYTVGDIVCVTPNKIFPFSIEVKNYKDLNFEHLLMVNVKSKLNEFWKQAINDGKRGSKIPMLLMRYNGLPKNFFFVRIPYKIAKIMFPKRPRYSFIYKNSLITTTDQIYTTHYPSLEPYLIKEL